MLLLCLILAGGQAVEAVCPVDGTKFRAVDAEASHAWGGLDADGCAHAFKSAPLETRVWVCPSCRFAGAKADFQKLRLGADEKKALLEGLRPRAEIRKGAAQEEVPGHVKYDLLAQVAAVRKAPPQVRGRAWLSASWSCRQQGAVDLQDFEEWDKLRDRYGLDVKPVDFGAGRNRTPFELEVAAKIGKEIAAKSHERGVNRALAPYLAALLHRRHGENADAERCLAAVPRGENSLVDAAAETMRASIALERDYQKRAIGAYAEALDLGTVDPKERPEVEYLLGELHRRRGEKEEALRRFRAAIETSAAPGFRKLAEAQAALVR